jgi:hypothetical protein
MSPAGAGAFSALKRHNWEQELKALLCAMGPQGIAFMKAYSRLVPGDRPRLRALRAEEDRRLGERIRAERRARHLRQDLARKFREVSSFLSALPTGGEETAFVREWMERNREEVGRLAVVTPAPRPLEGRSLLVSQLAQIAKLGFVANEIGLRVVPLKLRDLAVISLLCGHWPRDLQPRRGGSTTAEIIGAEMRTMDLALKRQGLLLSEIGMFTLQEHGV